MIGIEEQQQCSLIEGCAELFAGFDQPFHRFGPRNLPRIYEMRLDVVRGCVRRRCEQLLVGCAERPIEGLEVRDAGLVHGLIL